MRIASGVVHEDIDPIGKLFERSVDELLRDEEELLSGLSSSERDALSDLLRTLLRPPASLGGTDRSTTREVNCRPAPGPRTDPPRGIRPVSIVVENSALDAPRIM